MLDKVQAGHPYINKKNGNKYVIIAIAHNATNGFEDKVTIVYTETPYNKLGCSYTTYARDAEEFMKKFKKVEGYDYKSNGRFCYKDGKILPP